MRRFVVVALAGWLSGTAVRPDEAHADGVHPGEARAVAAGIVEGLAIGGIAATALAAPGGYGTVDLGPASAECRRERRRILDAVGNVSTRLVRVCD